jgi:hypothetical protein
MNDSDESELRSIKHELHLVTEELSGIREMGDHAVKALVGSNRAYGALAQRVEILQHRVELLETRPRGKL